MRIKILSDYFMKVAPKNFDIAINFKPIKEVTSNNTVYFLQETKLIECCNCSLYPHECSKRDKTKLICGPGEKRTIWLTEKDVKKRRKRFLHSITKDKIKEWRKKRF